MVKKIIILVVGISLLTASLVYASIDDVKMAILKKEYAVAKISANEVLGFAVVEKNLANETRYYLGLAELHLGEYQQAQRTFKDVIKAKPVDIVRDKAYLGLFDAYYFQGRYEKANKTVAQLMRLNRRSQQNSLIYLKAARAHLKMGKWDEANAYLQKVTQRYPDSFEAPLAKQLMEDKQFFAVQVGAFIERQRAEQLVAELKQNDKYAYIVETLDQHDQKFYRVRVGQLARLYEAKRLKSELDKKGYPTKIYP